MNIVFSVKSKSGWSSKTILNENLSRTHGQPQSNRRKDRSVQTSRRASRGWRRARGGGNLKSFKKQAVSIMIWENEMLFATPHSDLTAFKCTLKKLSQAENIIHTPFSSPHCHSHSELLPPCFLSRNKIFMAICLNASVKSLPNLTVLSQISPNYTVYKGNYSRRKLKL